MASAEDQLHLANMVSAINEIEEYARYFDYNKFVADEETRTAIVRNLQMIGDAATFLTDEFKDTYGEIDYNVLENLRYAMYNNETEIDPNFLWGIIENDLPVIREDVINASTQLSRDEDIS
jgi:uncharacterized protein with HEPN domain